MSRKEPEVTLEAMTDRFVMYSFGQEMAAGKWNTWIFVIHRCCYVSAFDILIFLPYFFMIDYFHCFSCNPIFWVLMNIVNFIHLKLKL